MFGSEAPGLVFAMTYLRGTRLRRVKFAPYDSAEPFGPERLDLSSSTGLAAERRVAGRQSLRKDTTTLPPRMRETVFRSQILERNLKRFCRRLRRFYAFEY